MLRWNLMMGSLKVEFNITNHRHFLSLCVCRFIWCAVSVGSTLPQLRPAALVPPSLAHQDGPSSFLQDGAGRAGPPAGPSAVTWPDTCHPGQQWLCGEARGTGTGIPVRIFLCPWWPLPSWSIPPPPPAFLPLSHVPQPKSAACSPVPPEPFQYYKLFHVSDQCHFRPAATGRFDAITLWPSFCGTFSA